MDYRIICQRGKDYNIGYTHYLWLYRIICQRGKDYNIGYTRATRLYTTITCTCYVLTQYSFFEI